MENSVLPSSIFFFCALGFSWIYTVNQRHCHLFFHPNISLKINPFIEYLSYHTLVSRAELNIGAGCVLKLHCTQMACKTGYQLYNTQNTIPLSCNWLSSYLKNWLLSIIIIAVSGQEYA